MQPGHGWVAVEALTGGRWGDAPALGVRGEFGWRVMPWLSTFAAAEANTAAWQATAGLRAEW